MSPKAPHLASYILGRPPRSELRLAPAKRTQVSLCIRIRETTHVQIVDLDPSFRVYHQLLGLHVIMNNSATGHFVQSLQASGGVEGHRHDLGDRYSLSRAKDKVVQVEGVVLRHGGVTTNSEESYNIGVPSDLPNPGDEARGWEQRRTRLSTSVRNIRPGRGQVCCAENQGRLGNIYKPKM